MEKACGSCIHWWRFGKTNVGECRVPLPYWMCEDRGPSFQPLWTVREDHIHKCNCYKQAETQETQVTGQDYMECDHCGTLHLRGDGLCLTCAENWESFMRAEAQRQEETTASGQVQCLHCEAMVEDENSQLCLWCESNARNNQRLKEKEQARKQAEEAQLEQARTEARKPLVEALKNCVNMLRDILPGYQKYTAGYRKILGIVLDAEKAMKK